VKNAADLGFSLEEEPAFQELRELRVPQMLVVPNSRPENRVKYSFFQRGLLVPPFFSAKGI